MILFTLDPLYFGSFLVWILFSLDPLPLTAGSAIISHLLARLVPLRVDPIAFAPDPVIALVIALVRALVRTRGRILVLTPVNTCH